jgi:hypothetical protein
MTDKTIPPASAPTEAAAQEAERRLFEGLARVKTFPVDPGAPGQPTSQMLPVSSFHGKEADRSVPRPEFVGPIEQAMRSHPGLTREKAEEMAEDLGFLAAPARSSQPTPAVHMPKPATNSTQSSEAHEIAWAKGHQELVERLRASGLTVTAKAPPKGTAPLVATFHRAKQKPTNGEN